MSDEVVKCKCGTYVYVDDIVVSVAKGIDLCPKCTRYCPNCSGIIGENEVLFANKCLS